jgi:predicted Zn-dependent protease
VTRPQELVERALALSKADECIVIIDDVTDANLRWASNTLTTNGVARSRDVTVISIRDQATGVVSREGVTLESLEDVVREAEEVSARAGPAQDHFPLLRGGGYAARWDEPSAETSIEVFSRLAPDLHTAFVEAGNRGHLLFGYASHEWRTTYLATSSGVRARHDQPTGHVEINGKSSDYSRSAWVGAPAPEFDHISVEALSGELSRRLAWSERQVDLPAGRYQTILPPSAVSDLMIYMYWSAGARDAHDGRTVFSRPGGETRVGDRLSDTAVSLGSDPNAPDIDCAPFVISHQSSSNSSVFDNGLELEPTDWIKDGSLSALVDSRYSARLTGLPCTPYIDNLIMSAADPGSDIDQMISETDFGLMLTCLWYIREVDPQTLLLTGLTRDGVYLVQQGEVTGAVNNFRFNESPVDLLGRIIQVGPSVHTLPREWCDNFTRATMPPLQVADFNMSSVSQAS